MSVPSVVGRQIIDLANDTNYYFEVAPQGDSQARFVDVTIMDNGAPYTIPAGSTLILEGKNAGGYNIFINCIQQASNVVRIPLTDGVLSFAGVGKYIVGIYHGESYINSFVFNIVVTEAPYDIISLQASDVYEALNIAIAKAMASNKWIVDNGDPDVLGVDATENDYYLDYSTGSLWQYARGESGLDWVRVVNATTAKQANIMEKIYVKYSMNPNGNPMYDTPYDTSTTPPTVRDYIGFFVTIDLPDDSEVSDPSNYSWSPLRIDVTNLITEYAKSDSYTTHPTTGWSATIPLITNDDYLWTKITLELMDGKSFTYYTVTQYGKYGDFGTPTSSIEETPGQPIVTVTVDPTSPSTAKVFDFDFKIRGGHWKTGTDVSGVGTQTVTTLNSANTVTGDMYFNTITGLTYRCTAVTDSNSTWVETREIRGGIWRFGTQISGSGIQTSTIFDGTNTIVGDVYVNTTTGKVYKCTAVTSSGSTWEESFLLTGATTIDDLSNTRRYYATLHPGDLSLNITGVDTATMFNSTDAAKGSGYYYHIKYLSEKPNVGPSSNFDVTITETSATTGQISVDLVFRKSATKNMQVTPSAGDNPQAKGWYEIDSSAPTGYSLTTDTTVVADKKYFEEVEFCLQVIKKNS